MNAPHPFQSQLVPAAAVPLEEDEGINLVEYWDIVADNRWLIGALVALTLVLGSTYALLARPVYEANLLVQVEDNAANAKDILGQAAGLFDTKTATTAEIEIIRSRLVIGKAVDNARLYVSARPRYLPVFGAALARHSTGLSDPGLFGFGGYVTGREAIDVPEFAVPEALEGTPFRLTAGANGQYTLTHPDLPDVHGVVGTRLEAVTPAGPVKLLVATLAARPGAQFVLVRRSRLAAIEELQQLLKLAEKGRQSGIIEATLRGPDPELITQVLNEIGKEYVHQNVERKAAEAEKTLAFLDVQMPQLKKQLNQAEENFTRYRNEKGTVSLDDEAKLILTESVDLQGKLVDAQQKRRELITRFTPEHPAVKTLDAQIGAWNTELERLNARIRRLPNVQQDALRLQRDVQVNNELYLQLRNSALQLQLVREGKIGNVRVIDAAARPEEPVGPNRLGIVGVATMLGLVGGVMLALARNAFFRGVRNSQEIEAVTGMNVYSTIPLSTIQAELARNIAERRPGVHLLALVAPDDPAVESLRSLRTALQFAMLDAKSNRIIITGATPGVGKSFASANFAALLASSGKRVLLIDADLRKGYLNQYFGVPRAKGLSELIIGSLQPEQVIRRGLAPSLDVITTGTLPPNPAELMMSSSVASVLDRISADYDLVIIDTAPVLVAADTAALALHAGTVLLVARAETTQLGELQECAKRLTHAGRSVTGVLLNALDFNRRHYGSYAYRHGGYRYTHYKYTAQR